jgi:hypothetical protein
LVALGIFFRGQLQSHHRIGEEIIRIRRMQQLLGKASLRRGWLEIVFVFGKILGHRDQLSPHIVPRIQKSL